MTRLIKYFFFLIVSLVIFTGCTKDNYQMGDLTAPSDITINTTIVGQDAANPDGDGSGEVDISITGKNALAYYIDYNAADGISLAYLPSGKITHKFTTEGVNTYRMTVVVYGKGATATTVTKEITLRSDFSPDPQLITDLTGDGSKTWSVNKDIAGHFGVGPWANDAANPKAWVTPSWWSAGVNEKVSCCNCFYTAGFTFTKNSDGSFKLTVTSPDGAFTKTGALAGGLPGIPGSGAEACYPYAGGSSSFSLVSSSSGISPETPSTKTAILLGGTNTYIGYGALLKEYEILEITENSLKLRAQGTETGNAWYLILKAN